MKKTLALILGVIMLMGCLSVSAASSALVVTEKPVKTYCDIDFSQTDENITIGDAATTKVEGGVLKITDAKSGHKANLYANANKDGIKSPVYVEFDLTHDGLFQTSGNAINLWFAETSGRGFVDLTWASDESLTLSDGGSNKFSKNFRANYLHFKVKFDYTKNTYAMWVNGDEFVSESEHNYFRNDPEDFAFLYLKTDAGAGSIAEITVDNFIVYSDGNTALPMYEELITTGNINETLSADKTYTFNAKKGCAVEVDVVATAGSSAYHSILIGDQASGTAVKIDWNALVEGGVISTRPYSDGWLNNGINYEPALYGADASNIKITALYNEAGDKAEIYINGKHLETVNFTGKDANATYVEVRVPGSHSITINSVRTYSVLDGLKIDEADGVVKIATNAAKAGNLYFAQYTGTEDAKSLNAIGSAALNLAPGKVYTVSKADWAGAKAFFWDADMKPIVDSWTLN